MTVAQQPAGAVPDDAPANLVGNLNERQEIIPVRVRQGQTLFQSEILPGKRLF